MKQRIIKNKVGSWVDGYGQVYAGSWEGLGRETTKEVYDAVEKIFRRYHKNCPQQDEYSAYRYGVHYAFLMKFSLPLLYRSLSHLFLPQCYLCIAEHITFIFILQLRVYVLNTHIIIGDS